MKDSKFIANLRKKYEFLATAKIDDIPEEWQETVIELCEELRLLQNASGISIYIYEIRNSGTVLYFERSYRVDLCNIFEVNAREINNIYVNNLYIWDRILDKVISNTELMTAHIATNIAAKKYEEEREGL